MTSETPLARARYSEPDEIAWCHLGHEPQARRVRARLERMRSHVALAPNTAAQRAYTNGRPTYRI